VELNALPSIICQALYMHWLLTPLGLSTSLLIALHSDKLGVHDVVLFNNNQSMISIMNQATRKTYHPEFVQEKNRVSDIRSYIECAGAKPKWHTVCTLCWKKSNLFFC
jgi:hypothetical protein